MAEIITGDTTKGIKNVGELALRISRYDSYRLFTLYENANERKVMNVSGNQKYYLVFRSPNNEIKIPEYEPKGFFEVDKVNGCILFKITKKNAENILSMKTGGEKIFYIVRTYEETDEYGRVLNVTDEVEVYHGKWGDDDDFTTFTTENKVDLLTSTLATQISKNETLLKEYQDLLEKYNKEVEKSGDLEREIEELRSQMDSLQTQLNDYLGDTYDGTVLSTDTKYIAFENSLENISFTEEQYKTALGELMTKGEVDLSGYELESEDDAPQLTLKLVLNSNANEIAVYKNGSATALFSAKYNKNSSTNTYTKTVSASHGDVFEFKCVGAVEKKTLKLTYNHLYTNGFAGAVSISNTNGTTINSYGDASIVGTMNYFRYSGEYQGMVYAVGNVGTLQCTVS